MPIIKGKDGKFYEFITHREVWMREEYAYYESVYYMYFVDPRLPVDKKVAFKAFTRADSTHSAFRCVEASIFRSVVDGQLPYKRRIDHLYEDSINDTLRNIKGGIKMKPSQKELNQESEDYLRKMFNK